jgi:hypothetical protein
MKLHCEESHFECAVGATVCAEVPKVDRGRGDAPSVLAVILERQEVLCQLGTRSGITKPTLCLVAVLCVCVCTRAFVCLKRNKFLLTKFLKLNYPSAPLPLLRVEVLFEEVKKIHVTVAVCQKLHICKTHKNILQQLTGCVTHLLVY